MLENNARIVNLDSKVSPIVLASILGVNISLVYQEAQAGRLPLTLTDSTYIECLQMYINHFKKSQDVKLAKEANEKEIRLAKEAAAQSLKEEKLRLKEEEARNKRSFNSSYDGEDGIHPLVAAKMKQNIKTELAREEQIWQKIAIERKDYIVSEEMVELCEPFIMSIRDIFLSVAQISPELEKKIDEGMENLYRLGCQLVEGADVDSKEYVRAMVDREIDV